MVTVDKNIISFSEYGIGTVGKLPYHTYDIYLYTHTTLTIDFICLKIQKI